MFTIKFNTTSLYPSNQWSTDVFVAGEICDNNFIKNSKEYLQVYKNKDNLS